jgi:hypothetical protein
LNECDVDDESTGSKIDGCRTGEDDDDDAVDGIILLNGGKKEGGSVCIDAESSVLGDDVIVGTVSIQRVSNPATGSCKTIGIAPCVHIDVVGDYKICIVHDYGRIQV